MSDTRDRIAEHVAANPGVHFNGLERALDLATGQVQHHLRRLRADGRVVAEECCGRTHYYPEGYGEWERRALALLRRETAADVVAVVLARGDVAPGDVAAELDLAASTVSYHVDRLVEHDVVEKREDAEGGVLLTAARPTATAELLAAADQPVADRLVDRFVRLVDHLLEGGPPESP